MAPNQRSTLKIPIGYTITLRRAGVNPRSTSKTRKHVINSHKATPARTTASFGRIPSVPLPATPPTPKKTAQTTRITGLPHLRAGATRLPARGNGGLHDGIWAAQRLQASVVLAAAGAEALRLLLHALAHCLAAPAQTCTGTSPITRCQGNGTFPQVESRRKRDNAGVNAPCRTAQPDKHKETRENAPWPSHAANATDTQASKMMAARIMGVKWAGKRWCARLCWHCGRTPGPSDHPCL